MRVVSLVPSVTESLLEWGVEPVACTRFCEQPGLRHVGGTKDPDIGAIVALRPDLVVVDREENRREDAVSLVAHGIDLLDLHVTSVASACTETRRLAAAVGVAVMIDAACDARPVSVRAFVPIWRRPWMTINALTYGASVLASLGVEVSHARAHLPYPEVTSDELAALGQSGVGLVLLPTEPYAFAERHIAELRHVAGITDVRIVDGRDLFWWGSRTPAALKRLSAQLADVSG